MFTKDIRYVKAEDNHMADWLSRKTEEAKIGEAYKIEKSEVENEVKNEAVDFIKLQLAAVSESSKNRFIESKTNF